MKESTPKKDVYSIITDKIIAKLEQGIIPWRTPWTKAGMPQNLISGKYYRGINVMLLASLGYAQNYFLSEKQVTEIGATIKEGEKPNMVVLWNWQEKSDGANEHENATQKKVPILRYYLVYNVSQCEGIPKAKIPEVKPPVNPILMMENIINEMPKLPLIVHIHDEAYYHFNKDLINIPPIDNFDSAESYYSVFIHELIHSTGHASRVGRKGIVEKPSFGSPLYALEELIAEIGACQMKSLVGIEKEDTEKNSIAYIQNWLSFLKSDKKAIVYASSFAQKAVDYILNVKWDAKESELSTDLTEALPLSDPTQTKKKARKKSDTV